MPLPRLIEPAMLEALSAEARELPRRRKNRNFHAHDADVAHRLLNAVEPGSYIAPHRHLDPSKDETMVVVRGELGVLFFDDEGRITQTARLAPNATCGVDIPHGTWHSVLACVEGTVFLEAKAGPYLPLVDAERAPWAPAEGSPQAVAYAQVLADRFSKAG